MRGGAEPAARGEQSARRRELADRLERAPPAYFAMVMATGIVSIACDLTGLARVAALLFATNVVAFAGLVLALFARTWLFPRAVLADLGDHQRGVGFFTCVAATAVVGTELAVQRGAATGARAMLGVAAALWALFTYAVFTALIVREDKPTLEKGIHGGWLVAVVATQSLPVLGCNVASTFGAAREPALFALLTLWLAGGMLYVWMMAIIFYRYTFFPMSPSDLMPPYWINMGAMAISALAGSLLVKIAPSSTVLAPLVPFLKGFSVWYWATATWWIPMLVILGVWRHAVRRFPLAYDPAYWGAVFPLGMYTVSTQRLGEALEAPFLLVVPRVGVWIALAAWALAFAGFVRHAGRLVRAIAAPPR